MNVDHVDVEFFWSKTHDGKIVATLDRWKRWSGEEFEGREQERTETVGRESYAKGYLICVAQDKVTGGLTTNWSFRPRRRAVKVCVNLVFEVATQFATLNRIGRMALSSFWRFFTPCPCLSILTSMPLALAFWI